MIHNYVILKKLGEITFLNSTLEMYEDKDHVLYVRGATADTFISANRLGCVELCEVTLINKDTFGNIYVGEIYS